MAWTGDPVWLADVLRAEGLKVVEHDGWKNRGHGDFKDVRGVLCHHTAGGGENDWKVVQYGRSDLPGPLAQLVLERDGTFRVIAAGVCWHAGRGAHPGWPTNNANWHVIGIEAVNNGVGQPWPAAQIDAYKRGCAAILRRLGRGENDCVGHKEYSSEGKIDPAGIDMNAFRRDVREIIHRGSPATPGAAAPQPARNEIDYVRSFSDWLGERLHDGERDCKDGVGKYADFEHGSIYHHPRSGTVPVPTLVYEVWKRNQWEQGFLGYPKAFHVVVPNQGDIQVFEGGTIARRYGTEGFCVYGKIEERWRADGDVRTDRGAQLGWPTSNEYDHDGGRRQDFEHGSIIWHPTGAVTLIGGSK